MTDMVISGNSCHIDCWSSRFSVEDYSIIFETWMNKSNLQDLRSSIVPGAVRQLYKILGRPHFSDTTWQGNNTIQLIPKSDTQMDKMRGKNYVVFPKNIVTSPIEGDKGWIWVKLESFVSGSSEV